MTETVAHNEHFNWGHFRKFVDEFKDESDRAAVVLGAAKLDSLLQQILDRHLLPSLSSSDELLDGDSPLATFSSRINASYRLGLVTAEFAKQLHLIRRIRNAFAHETSGCSLEHGPHADRLKSLLLPFLPLPFFKKFKEEFFGESKTLGSSFKACLAIMAARLEFRLLHTVTINSDEAWNCIRADWSHTEVSAAQESAELQ